MVLPEKFQPTIDEGKIFEFLKNKLGKIEGVVVSGGEPTLHDDLEIFLKNIRALGFSTKLDTNGTHPEVLQRLYEEKLLNYVAMDVKHKFEKYEEIVGTKIDIEAVKQSIDLIKNSSIDYEFRTTVVPYFHTAEDLKAIACQLSGAARFCIQEFVPDHALNKNLNNKNSLFSPQNAVLLGDLTEFCKSHVRDFVVRSAY
jgi:pyruvate formate lyase activating enzyme